MDPKIISALNQKVRDLQHQVIRYLHRTPRLAVWDISPWEEVLPREGPPPKEANLKKLNIVAGQREYESQAFMVTNLSDRSRTLTVDLARPLGSARQMGRAHQTQTRGICRGSRRPHVSGRFAPTGPSPGRSGLGKPTNLAASPIPAMQLSGVMKDRSS